MMFEPLLDDDDPREIGKISSGNRAKPRSLSRRMLKLKGLVSSRRKSRPNSTEQTPVKRDLPLGKNQQDTPTTLVNSPLGELTPVKDLFSSDSKDVIFLFTPETDVEDWHQFKNNDSKTTNQANPNCQGNAAPVSGDSQVITTDHDFTVRIVTVPPERRNQPENTPTKEKTASNEDKIEPVTLVHKFDEAADSQSAGEKPSTASTQSTTSAEVIDAASPNVGAAMNCKKPAQERNSALKDNGKSPNSNADKTRKKQVAFREDVVRVLQRSKDEISMMLEQWSSASSTDNSIDLDREVGRYFDATKDLASKCVEPLKQFQSSSPEPTGDVPSGEAKSFRCSNPFELSFNAAADKPSTSPNAPQKPGNEKWDNLVEHLERARLTDEEEKSYQADGEESKENSHARCRPSLRNLTTISNKEVDTHKNKSFYSEEKSAETIFESTDDADTSFVAEIRKVLSKAGKSFQDISDQVKTLTCTNAIAEDFIICHDASPTSPKGNADKADWDLQFVMTDRSWLSIHEENCEDSISKLTNPRDLSSIISSDLTEIPRIESHT